MCHRAVRPISFAGAKPLTGPRRDNEVASSDTPVGPIRVIGCNGAGHAELTPVNNPDSRPLSQRQTGALSEILLLDHLCQLADLCVVENMQQGNTAETAGPLLAQ